MRFSPADPFFEGFAWACIALVPIILVLVMALSGCVDESTEVVTDTPDAGLSIDSAQLDCAQSSDATSPDTIPECGGHGQLCCELPDGGPYVLGCVEGGGAACALGCGAAGCRWECP